MRMRRTTLVLAAALLWASITQGQTPTPTDFPNRPTVSPVTARPMQPRASISTKMSPLAVTPPRISLNFGDLQLVENLVHFDDRIVELQWHEGHWQLWAGPELIKDFGPRQAEARQALSLVRELHLTERGTVGTPRTIMEYWLSDGRAPAGMLPAVRSMPIDQGILRTEQIQGYWCVRDNTNTFFNFGTHQDEAEQALAIMKRYGFSRLGLVGQGRPVMLVFVGSPTGMKSTTMHAPPPPSSRVITQQHVESTSLPFADAPPSSIQPSHIVASNNLTKSTLPGGNEPNKNSMPSAGIDLNAAALPVGRQLAPPSGPSPDLSTLSERVPLDYHQVHLYHDRQDWKLLCGDYVIANFGPDEREARLGEIAFRSSHFTEQCLIGHPKPVFSYFLVNGRPPQGLPFGAAAVAFRPQELSVRQVNGAWTICDPSRVLFAFGDKADEAKETLKAIQKHNFDTFCRLGQGEQSMTILARTR
jgi:hypothetical protein